MLTALFDLFRGGSLSFNEAGKDVDLERGEIVVRDGWPDGGRKLASVVWGGPSVALGMVSSVSTYSEVE